MPATISRINADYDLSRVPEEPAIGLAMAFQPTAQSKNEISNAINFVLANVKSRYHVATKLIVNETFYLADLIEKKQTAPQLHFLLLTDCWAKLYHFENHVLQRVGFHRTEYYQPCLFPEPDLSESLNRDVISNENTLFKAVNCNLSYLYQKIFCPLIIAGNTDTLKEFTSATTHKHHIVNVVSMEKSCVGDGAILELLRPATSKGSQFRQKYFLNIMRDAYRRNNLLFGPENVEQASSKGWNSLMVIDKEQTAIKRYGSHSGKTTDRLTRLDTMIEKILNSNGHVELIESGMPAAYGGVVLLQRKEHLHH